MKTLLQYINEDNNLDKVQMEIDDIKPNESDQLSKIDADAIKSLIINNDSWNNPITVVSKKNGTYTIKFAKHVFIENDKISDTIVNICKYFKQTMGAKEVKIDNKKFLLEIK